MGTTADRRTFLATSARAIIGAFGCTQFGCRQPTPRTDGAGQRAGIQRLIADLEERIPKLLTAHVGGQSTPEEEAGIDAALESYRQGVRRLRRT